MSIASVRAEREQALKRRFSTYKLCWMIREERREISDRAWGLLKAIIRDINLQIEELNSDLHYMLVSRERETNKAFLGKANNDNVECVRAFDTFFKNVDLPSSFFRVGLAEAAVEYEDRYWIAKGGDFREVNLGMCFHDEMSVKDRQNKLQELWDRVKQAKKTSSITEKEFRACYYAKYVEALRLKREIFELQEARRIVPKGYRTKCRSTCTGMCRQCFVYSEYRQGVELEKVKINRLLTIYQTFADFINRYNVVKCSDSSKRASVSQEEWLRLKGYLYLLEEFGVWVRDNSCKKRKNLAAKRYLKTGDACDVRVGVSYKDEFDVDWCHSTKMPRFVGKKIKNKTRSPITPYEASQWYALSKRDRKNSLSIMTNEEYKRVMRIQSQYSASIVVKYAKPIMDNSVKQHSKKIKEVVTEFKKVVSKRVCVACNRCSRVSSWASSIHLTSCCAYLDCANYKDGGSLVRGFKLPPGTVINFADYEEITNSAFETACYLPHDGYTVERNHMGISMSSASTGVRHAGRDGDGFVDVVTSDVMYPVTPSVTVNGVDYTVGRKKILDWNYNNGQLTYQVCRTFKESRKLLSGTPIFNEKGEICSLVTGSHRSIYAISSNFNLSRTVFVKAQDVYLKLYELSYLLDSDYVIIKHSANAVTQGSIRAKNLAEARISTAVVAGELEAVARKLKAIKEVQTNADNKMAAVMSRDMGINQVVRRRKRKNINISTTITIAIALSLGVLSALGEVVPKTNPHDEFKIVEESIKGGGPKTPMLCNRYLKSYDFAIRQLAQDNYEWEGHVQEITDMFQLVGQHQYMYQNLVRISSERGWKIDANEVVIAIEKCLTSDGAATERYRMITETLARLQKQEKFTVENTAVLKKIALAEEKQLNQFKKQKKAFDEHDKLVQQMAEEQRNLLELTKRQATTDVEKKIEEKWLKVYGRTKAAVVGCLQGHSNVDVADPDLLEAAIEKELLDKLVGFDYERAKCLDIRQNHKHVQTCTKPDIARRVYREFSHKCDKYYHCKVRLIEVINLLKVTFESNLVTPTVNHNTCDAELVKLEAQFKNIKLHSHKSRVAVKPTKTQQCQENVNWKQDGWLAGLAGSCVTGIGDESWRVRGCVDLPVSSCIHKPEHKCTLGWGNIIWIDGKVFSNSHKNVTDVKCCSLHCHKIESVYEIFTHQPYCTDCIKPFTPIFWTDKCLADKNKKAIESISIMRSKTIFDIQGEGEIVCNNAWSFNLCCGGKGPASSVNSDTFKDKHCVCQQASPSYFDLFVKKVQVLRDQFFTPVHLLFFIIIFIVFVTSRGLGIVVFIVYCSWLVVSVDGACSVENMVPIDATVSVTGVSNAFSQVKMKPGQCISVGDATVELVGVEVASIYNFLRTIPYHIKPVCQLLDWGCPGGLANGVYDKESDCYKNCIPGMRKQWEDSEYDWIGDKCFLNGRVATRLDVCFSYGAPNTFVELYTRVSGTPILRLTVKFHGVGFESVGHITTSSLGDDTNANIIDVVTQPLFWPEMISYRLGKYLCAYHYVESTGTCNSGDVFKPTDIDVDCLDLRKKWNTAHGGYELTFGKKDFENQLNTHFVDCGLQFEVTNNVTTMEYSQHIDWVEFKIVGDHFKFAKATPYCRDISQWTITSEPGLTYYHRRTQIKYINRGDKCKIFVAIDGCVSTNGNLIVLEKADNFHIIEYWCGANATGMAHITVAGNRVETKELKVLNNYLPHKNTVRNNFEKVLRAATLSDVQSWVSDFLGRFDFKGFYGYLQKVLDYIWSFSWPQVAIGVILVFLAYSNFIRGRVIATIVIILLFWLVCLTKLVFAYKTVHDHGGASFVQSVWRFCYHMCGYLIMLDVNIAGVVSYVVKLCVVTMWWMGAILGCYNIYQIERLVSKTLKWLTIVTVWYFCGIIPTAVTVICISFVEILDKVAIVSGCENMSMLYGGVMTSLITMFQRSVATEDFSETDDSLLYIDSPHDTDKHKLAAIRSYVQCSGATVNIDNIVLPDVVLNFNWIVVNVNGVTYTHINDGFEPKLAVMSHSINGLSGDNMVISGESDMWSTVYVEKPSFVIGHSGMPVLVGDTVEWFSGLDNGKPKYNNIRLVQPLKWTYADGTKYHIMAKSPRVIQVAKTDGVTHFCGPNYYAVKSGNYTQVFSKAQNLIVSNGANMANFGLIRIGKEEIELNDATSLFVLAAGTAVIEKEQLQYVVTGSDNKVVDAFGREYEKLPTGLVNDLCWPEHVLAIRGFVGCNDIRMKTRNGMIQVPKKTRYIRTTDMHTGRAIKSNVVGYVWWPCRALSDVQQPIRLQRSRFFECEIDLVSGTLIYVDTHWFFGDVEVVSCITGSFVNNNKKCYVVSSPGDTYVSLSLTNKRYEGIPPDWPCGKIDSGTTVNSLYVRKLEQGKSAIELYNAQGGAMHRLLHDVSDMPVMTWHSPGEKLVELFRHSKLFENVQNVAYFVNTDVVGNTEHLVVKLLRKVADDVLETRIMSSAIAEKTFRKISKMVTNDTLALVSESMQRLKEVAVVPNGRRVMMGYECLAFCYYRITGIYDECDWAPSKIVIIVSDDENKYEESRTGNQYIQIVCGRGDVVKLLKEKLQEVLCYGIRHIAVTVGGSHLGNLVDLSSVLEMPLVFALSTVIDFRCEYPDIFMKLMDPVKDEEISQVEKQALLRAEWREGERDTVRMMASLHHEQSIKRWKDVVPSPSWDMRTIGVRVGEQCSSFEQLGLVTAKSMLVGSLKNMVTRGSFFYYEGSFVTNWHVTKARDVYVTSNGLTYKFSKPVFSNRELDICMYGKKLEFEKVEIGEVVTAFNPIGKFGLHYLVKDTASTLQSRPGNSFLKLMPVNIDESGKSTVISSPPWYGMSGSPIVNIAGKPVGIFGLGLQQVVSLGDNNLSTVVTYSGSGEMRLENTAFFDMCAKNFVNSNSGADVYHYCNAPTGTGKTTMLPPYIVKWHTQVRGTGCKVLILQPNVASVTNCSKHMSTVLETMDIKSCKVGFEVGVQNMLSQLWEGGDRETDSEIMIKTYGKNYESWNKMVSYDYIILDEVHVVRDPNLVATLLRIKTTSQSIACCKFLYLSATHLNVENGIDIAEGETLSSSPKQINSITWELSSAKEASIQLENKVIITQKIIRHMPDESIAIDSRYLRDGLVLFFCATKRDCDQGSKFGNSLGIKSWSYHGDSSQSVYEEFNSHLGNGWIFATDIIQQSVTLPSLTCVVDFMSECRPKVSLSRDPLQYFCTIESRTIDLVTQVQRKGRVGRTRDGTYISGKAAVDIRKIENFVIPEVVLKLLDANLDIANIKSNDPLLQQEVRAYSWLSPNYLARHFPSNLVKVKHGFMLNYTLKLALTRNRDFDRVKWYVRPCYATEERKFYSGANGVKIIGAGVNQFWKEYSELCCELSQKQVADISLEGLSFISFKDPYDSTLRQIEFLEEVSMADLEGVTSVDVVQQEALMEQSLPAFTVCVAGIACVYALFEKLIDMKTSRLVTHVSCVVGSKIAHSARHLAMLGEKENKELQDTWRVFSRLRSWAVNNGKKIYSKLRPTVEQSGVNNYAEFLNMLKNWFLGVGEKLVQFYASYGGDTNMFAGFVGGSLLGGMYRDLEKAVGRPMAMIITVASAGLVGALFEMKIVAVFCASTFISMVTRAVISTTSDSFGYNQSGTAWAAVISLASGVAIGQALKISTVQRTATKLSNHAADLAVSSKRNVGQVGIPVLLVKHVYRMLKSGDSSATVVAGVSVAGLLLETNWVTIAYAAVIGAGIFALEQLALLVFDRYVTRDYSNPENGKYLRDKREQLEHFAGYLLNAMAMIVYPESLLSMIIAILFSWAEGKDIPGAISKSWDTYSGVSPVLTLITEVINYISGQNVLQSASFICAIKDKIVSLASNLRGIVTKFCDFMKNAWLALKSFLGTVRNTISGGVSDCFKQAINESVGNKFVRSVLGMGSLKAVEPKIVCCTDPLVQDYFLKLLKTSGLTSVERYWIRLKPAELSVFGDNSNNAGIAKIKASGLDITKGCSVQSKCPLNFYKINLKSISDLVSELVGTCSLEGNVLVADLKSGFVSAKVEFYLTFDDNEILAVLYVKTMLIQMAWVINGMSADSASSFKIYEYGETDGFSDVALTMLGDTCGLLVDTKEDLSEDECKNWDTVTLGAREIKSRFIGKTLMKAASIAIPKTQLRDTIRQKILDYAVPPYVFDPKYSTQQFGKTDNVDYCRYWAGPLSAHYYHQDPFNWKFYYDTKWNLPYGHKSIWLSEWIGSMPDISQHKELVCGLKYFSGWWSTPILVTSSISVIVYTMELAALNHGVNIRFTHPSGNEWRTRYSVDGSQSRCVKCWLDIVYDGRKYYYKQNNAHCAFYFQEMDIEELKQGLCDMYKAKDKIEVKDVNFLACLFSPGTSSDTEWRRPLISQEGSPIGSIIMVGEDKEILMSENIIHRIMSFLGLLDPVGPALNVNILDRVNYLFTVAQLEEDQDVFYECETPVFKRSWIQGFEEATKGEIRNWLPFKDQPKLVVAVSPHEVLAMHRMLKSLGSGSRWETISNKSRYKLPKNLVSSDDIVAVTQSRGFYKMQQLHEAYPGFFDNSFCIVDVACGYGGFEECLANLYLDKAPRVAFVSTLIEGSHRVPNVNKLSLGNFKSISLIHPGLGTGNLRREKTVAFLKKAIVKVASPDLVIFDIGEFCDTSEKQYDWWAGKHPGSLVDGMSKIIELLRPGGKLLLKWTGYFAGGDILLHKLIGRFKEWRVLKLGTSSLFSTEFYVYCSGYSTNIRELDYVKNFYDHIGEQIYTQLTKAKLIYYHPKNYETLERTDWMCPQDSDYGYKIVRSVENKPPDVQYEFRVNGDRRIVAWPARWSGRIERFKDVLNYLYSPTHSKRLQIVEANSGKFENLSEYGYISKKLPTENLKDCYNGLLSDLAWTGFKMDRLNSPVALTQVLPKQREASFKKRLDVSAPMINPQVADELRSIMQLLLTEYGKSLLGKLRLMDKARVEVLLNKQGATSIMSKSSNLKAFMDANPSWYELCMKLCVNRWAKDQDTHCFFNVMHKNEPKRKKNVDKGKIILKNVNKSAYSVDALRDELEDECLLGHRFIQYADEITRISHYIVLGELIEAANKQKLYKGTINGAPPYVTGNILRATWDITSEKKDRFFPLDHQKHGINTNYAVKLGTSDKRTCGVIIDFSSFDTTVSVAERMAECDWVKQFFSADLTKVIDNMFREMCHAICVDHYGKIWLRSGQRGSGEIVTSLGNTLICIANIMRCIKRATGGTSEEVTKTVSTLEYSVSGKTKVLEIMPVMLFGDGDDIVIITTEDIAQSFMRVCEETLQNAGKAIRSGSGPGCSVVFSFYELEFCSHTYEAVLIGEGANYVHKYTELKALMLDKKYVVRFMPTRSTSEIIGKLRATLKRETMMWNYSRPYDRAVEVTRGKVMSYLILYPHMRYVRITCLVALALLGDGNIDIKKFSRRYPDLDEYQFLTVRGALESVHGVSDMDSFSLRNYRADALDAKTMEYNSSLTHFKTKNDITGVTNRLFQFMMSKRNYQRSMLYMDSKIGKRFDQFLSTN